LEHTK
jgi:hypothetical protein